MRGARRIRVNSSYHGPVQDRKELAREKASKLRKSKRNRVCKATKGEHVATRWVRHGFIPRWFDHLCECGKKMGWYIECDKCKEKKKPDSFGFNNDTCKECRTDPT